jgi:lipoprotein-anchoring transpeptidase ErfK/SrfK
LANGVHGFVRPASVQITHNPYSVEINRPTRQLTLWRLGVPLRRIGIAVGAPSTPTPLGRFSITDKLRNFWSAYYGCCVLALSGRQTRATPGWLGGKRLAIHAGTGVGSAVSNGCLRATTSSMQYLMRLIPVGTQVIVHD